MFNVQDCLDLNNQAYQLIKAENMCRREKKVQVYKIGISC